MLKAYVTDVEYANEGAADTSGMSSVAVHRALALASLKIDGLTFNRIGSIDRLTPFQRELVKIAVILQTDYAIQNGTADDYKGDLSSFSSVDISMSYQKAAGGLSSILKEHGVSPEAYSVLLQTGLLNRRV